MAAPDEITGISRRDFLKATATVCGAFGLAGSTAIAARDCDRVLVIIRLAGGNDGLNTIVPFFEDQYYRHRPALAIPEKDTLPLESGVGLHPALTGLKTLYDSGRLTIIQGVGLPHPCRSHHHANTLWWLGGGDKSQTTSWTERHLAATVQARLPHNNHTLETSRRLLRSVGPATTETFSSKLRAIADAIATGDPAKAYDITLCGFDTHAHQATIHTHQLKCYGDAMQDFIRRLSRYGMSDRVITMTYTEFGRRPAENPLGGTDHGHAAPVFLTGDTFPGGLMGKHPTLHKTPQVQLQPTTDYRNVIAMVTKDWQPGSL